MILIYSYDYEPEGYFENKLTKVIRSHVIPLSHHTKQIAFLSMQQVNLVSEDSFFTFGLT